MPPFVAGQGPSDFKLMIVGGSPSAKDVEANRPFGGPAGEILETGLHLAGVRLWETFRTYCVKYQAPMGDWNKYTMVGINVEEEFENFWTKEVRYFKPNAILAIGPKATELITGLKLKGDRDGDERKAALSIYELRGSILRSKDGDIKVIPTLDPSLLFMRPERGGINFVFKKIIESDIARACEESLTADFNLPDRTHDICSSSLKAYRFFDEYKKLGKPSVDIESINCIPVSIAFAFTPLHSCTFPLLRKVGNNHLTDMGKGELIQVWQFIQEALWEHELVGHNFKYDQYKLELARFRIGKLFSDTLLKTHTIFPELPDKKLNVLSSLWTREPFYKDEGREGKFGKAFNVTQFFRYNGKDACVTKEIDIAQEDDLCGLAEHFKVPLVDFYYNYVMRKHLLYLRMENKGIRIDFDRQKELAKDYKKMWEETHNKLNNRLEEIFSEEFDFNVKSYPQVYEMLYKRMGFKPYVKNPTSEDSIIALLNTHAKGKRAVYAEPLRDILTERRIRDQLSRAINFVPDYDGRAKTAYKITGTETARTSTNTLKKPLRPKKLGLAFHTIPKHGKFAKRVRSMLVPDEGKVFIQADASQAEARIVAVLGEDWELLLAFDRVDIHRRTAGLFFGFTKKLILTAEKVPIVDELEKDGPERFTGKMFRHAGNYDMGKARAANEFNVNAQKYEIDMEISEWRAGQYIDLFHGASPRIRGVFHQSIQDAINSTRSLVNPFGRPRVFNGRMDTDLYKEAYAYIPQSTVADLVQNAALKINDELNGDAEAYFVSENHDALVMEAPANNWEPYARLMQKHMMAPIDFGPYCSLKRDYKLIIPSDVEVSIDKEGKITNYGELYKAKLPKIEVAMA